MAEERQGSVSALSAGTYTVYTTTLLVMVDRMGGGGRALPQKPPAWADFTIMMEMYARKWHCPCDLHLRLSLVPVRIDLEPNLQ